MERAHLGGDKSIGEYVGLLGELAGLKKLRRRESAPTLAQSKPDSTVDTSLEIPISERRGWPAESTRIFCFTHAMRTTRKGAQFG